MAARLLLCSYLSPQTSSETAAASSNTAKNADFMPDKRPLAGWQVHVHALGFYSDVTMLI